MLKKCIVLGVAYLVMLFAACSNNSPVISEPPSVEYAMDSSTAEIESLDELTSGEPNSEPERESCTADTSEGVNTSISSQETIAAQTAPVISAISVKVESLQGILGQHEYTNPQQIERLLRFISEQDKLIPVDERKPLTGGVTATIEFVSGNTPQRWFFTSAYATHHKPDGSVDWYDISKKTWELLLRMTDWNPDALTGDPAYYNGELVTALYSLDGSNCSYQFVANPNKIAKIVSLLEQEPVQTTGKAGALGFLVFTEKGKYAYTITERSTELAQLALEYNKYDSLRCAQWLCYMSPENIESVNFGGLDASGDFGVGVQTTDTQSIKKIAAFLKSIVVEPNPTTFSGRTNPVMVSGWYELTLRFKTGVTYTICGYDDVFIIHTDDLAQSICYTATEGQIPALLDFMALLPEAELSPFML